MMLVIAYENRFTLDFKPIKYINTCVLKGTEVYLYNSLQEFIPLGNYHNCIDSISHVIKQGTYAWAFFPICEGDVITFYIDNVMINNEMVEVINRLAPGRNGISNRTLKSFNDFLKLSDKDNPNMVNALGQSLHDGYFRKEVEKIIKDDMIITLSNLDQEIIVRSRIEGRQFVNNYVEKELRSEKVDLYININYFFRRLFNLEVNNYISFESHLSEG
jgi:hypothetical protein